ncbi:HD-GYP domain-containing protein [Paenibacillus thiaminolyticus]|nr:HD domain-containing phosphohydrolase [Paenibacillus thiaminolyticus]
MDLLNEAINQYVRFRSHEAVEDNVDILSLFDRLKVVDFHTAQHSIVVAYVSSVIAAALPSSWSKRSIYLAGLFHDIGKLHWPRYLFSQVDMYPTEREMVQQHPVEGHRLLTKYNAHSDCLDACLYHHERLNGSGFPCGTKTIPPAAAIVSVADTFTSIFICRGKRQGRETRLHVVDALFAEAKENRLHPIYVDVVVEFFTSIPRRKADMIQW